MNVDYFNFCDRRLSRLSAAGTKRSVTPARMDRGETLASVAGDAEVSRHGRRQDPAGSVEGGRVPQEGLAWADQGQRRRRDRGGILRRLTAPDFVAVHFDEMDLVPDRAGDSAPVEFGRGLLDVSERFEELHGLGTHDPFFHA